MLLENNWLIGGKDCSPVNLTCTQQHSRILQDNSSVRVKGETLKLILGDCPSPGIDNLMPRGPKQNKSQGNKL